MIPVNHQEKETAYTSGLSISGIEMDYKHFVCMDVCFIDCKWPPGPPRQTRTCTTDKDLSVLISWHTAWKRAQDHERWRQTVETAMFLRRAS